MTTLEEKERHSWRRKRNFLAKELRSNAKYKEKVVPVKVTRDKKINPRNVEDFIND